MRTTLTLDDDVAVLVQEEVRRSGDSFKGTVNNLLRKGLTASRDPQPSKPFAVEPLFMGVNPGQNYDNIEALIEELEGPYHR